MKKTLISILITAILLTACSSLPKANSSASNNQAASNQPPAAANTQPAPSLSPDEVYQAVAAAWTKLESAGPRHISQTMYKGGNAVSNTEADSVPPNFHQVSSVAGTVMAEQYVFGGTIYNKLNGVWTQTPGASTAISALSGLSQALDANIVRSVGKASGIEVVNGSPAIIYNYSTTLKGLTTSTQYTLWVDQTSGLPVKQETLNSEGIKIIQTITYDSSITLTLPAEAKNAATIK